MCRATECLVELSEVKVVAGVIIASLDKFATTSEVTCQLRVYAIPTRAHGKRKQSFRGSA